eukprot:scaffold56841_cov30-Tisochrysis_lutea.AAC.1
MRSPPDAPVNFSDGACADGSPLLATRSHDALVGPVPSAAGAEALAGYRPSEQDVDMPPPPSPEKGGVGGGRARERGESERARM